MGDSSIHIYQWYPENKNEEKRYDQCLQTDSHRGIPIVQ